jgi:mRNA-degrading endonuclease toxin of MazEF toxin-antitoxin module
MRVNCLWTRSAERSVRRFVSVWSRRAHRSDERATAQLPRPSSACMAKRADVLVARRRLGFAAEGRRERFVVLQSDLLAVLETIVIAPLDDDGPIYQGDPLVVPVPAREAGTRIAQVALVHLLTSAAADRFDDATTGRLTARTMARIDDALRFTLDIG